MASKNDITGDVLQSRMNSKQFEENFDKIFGNKFKCNGFCGHHECLEHKDDCIRLNKQSRMDVIGQNGNSGDHYELDDGQLTDEQYEKIKEYEYELNKSTGDVEKRFTDGISKPNGEQFGNESDSTES